MSHGVRVRVPSSAPAVGSRPTDVGVADSQQRMKMAAENGWNKCYFAAVVIFAWNVLPNRHGR